MIARSALVPLRKGKGRVDPRCPLLLVHDIVVVIRDQPDPGLYNWQSGTAPESVVQMNPLGEQPSFLGLDHMLCLLCGMARVRGV